VNQMAAPGWTANWLNAWLAAIGATVLVDGLRLRWHGHAVPCAVFAWEGHQSLHDLLEAALPSSTEMERYAVARRLGGLRELKRNAEPATFAERAAFAREHGDWTLGATQSDLMVNARGHVYASPLYKGGPGPVGTIHDRLLDVRCRVDAATIEASLAGRNPRVERFGLGFDERRFFDPTYGVATGSWVDPAVEVFAFFGMLLFPTRGDGRSGSTRGWKGEGREEVLEWTAWRPLLSVAGIDALLDHTGRGGVAEGVRYRSVLRETAGEYKMAGYGSLLL